MANEKKNAGAVKMVEYFDPLKLFDGKKKDLTVVGKFLSENDHVFGFVSIDIMHSRML